jgi:hypothetical protein
VRAGDDPSVVAKVALKAATSRTPKLRYPAGPLARQLTVLKKFAPEALLDKGFARQTISISRRNRIGFRRMSGSRRKAVVTQPLSGHFAVSAD